MNFSKKAIKKLILDFKNKIGTFSFFILAFFLLFIYCILIGDFWLIILNFEFLNQPHSRLESPSKDFSILKNIICKSFQNWKQ